jgi:p-hydroxybenzoate 3-monooxygenase
VKALPATQARPFISVFETGVCEFRAPDRRVVIDYGSLTGGRPHFIYPQHLLVETMCETLLKLGADLRFSSTVEATLQTAAGIQATVTSDGTTTTLNADILVGCDGARSTVAALVPDANAVEEHLPARMLAVIGATPPLVEHTIYALHPTGYGAQMRRTPAQTRFYVSITDNEQVTDWSQDRIRDALSMRLSAGDALEGVEFTDPSIVDLRMRMPGTMQHGHVFLAGDAAHVITPFGGKGMNLAIADSVELAHGIVEASDQTCASTKRLDAYSATRIPVIWRTQAFSQWMVRMVMGSAVTPNAGFGHGVGAAWIDSLERDPLLATWFAHSYAGVDPANNLPCVIEQRQD